ncbi:hypothetical protein WDU94_006374 [Cyamophila willieti]
MKHLSLPVQQMSVSLESSLVLANKSSESLVQLTTSESLLKQNNSQDHHMELLSGFPVCSEKHRLIFASPCEAGCQQMCTEPNRTQFFTNCSSLPEETAVLSTNLCPKSSFTQMVWFLYIFIVIKCMLITTRVVSIFLSMRCVPKQDRVISLGVTLGLTTLISMWDQENFAVTHIIELALLSLIITSIEWYLLKNLPLYNNNESSNFSESITSQRSFGKNHKAPQTSRIGETNFGAGTHHNASSRFNR